MLIRHNKDRLVRGDAEGGRECTEGLSGDSSAEGEGTVWGDIPEERALHWLCAPPSEGVPGDPVPFCFCQSSRAERCCCFHWSKYSRTGPCHTSVRGKRKERVYYIRLCREIVRHG